MKIISVLFGISFLLGYFSEYGARDELLGIIKRGDIASGGAAYALGEMGDEEAMADIASLLKNSDEQTRF